MSLRPGLLARQADSITGAQNVDSMMNIRYVTVDLFDIHSGLIKGCMLTIAINYHWSLISRPINPMGK